MMRDCFSARVAAACAAFGCALLALALALPSEPEARTLTRFSYKDCSGPNPIIKVHSASVSEPVRIPGDTYASAHFDFTQEVKAPLKLELKIWRKVLFVWIPIPCIADIGSCTYNDICSYPPPLPPGLPCPLGLDNIGLSCRCPLPAKSLNFRNHKFSVPSLGAILDFLASGRYSVRLTGQNAGRELVCVESEFNMG